MSRLLIIALILSLTGCCYPPATNDPMNLAFKADIPTIGFVADTQLQTENVHSNTSILNNRLVDDLLVEVAVRTTAQNELAEAGLGALLDELAVSGAEIVFYLGDGLNNGCEDEADRFFGILQQKQKATPIFMTIGNHDYLASGNSRRDSDRKNLCGESNKPLSKYEIAERIEALNQASFALHKDELLHGYSYTSSKALGDMVCSESSKQDSEENCFYAGVLKNPVISFLLLDTSHYENVGTYGELTGAKGYVGSSQIDWFLDSIGGDHTPRILLSHYSATAFSGYFSIVMDAIHLPTKISRVGELLNNESDYGNLWVWGHSHSATGILTQRSITGLENVLSIETYEVGSTTDFGNAGALISSSEGQISADTQPMCQLFSTKACSELPSALQGKHISKTLPGRTMDDSVGITKAYQRGEWNLTTDRTVRANIRNLTDNHFEAYNFSSPEEMKLCMLRLASANEATGSYSLKGLEGGECVQEERSL